MLNLFNKLNSKEDIEEFIQATVEPQKGQANIFSFFS